MTHRIFTLLAACLFPFALIAEVGQVAVIDVRGTINPATAGYIARSVARATESDAACLIVRLDTPGGLLDSTKEIVQAFYRSPVPIVVYVGPAGANATSAGCFITMASDVAAMAPDTSIGAAHPVAIGGGGGDDAVDPVMKTKLENFTASYIETIAHKRGRNVEWARSAVLESANITAEVALETQVIEIIATDLPDLLQQLDGRRVGERTLETAGAKVWEIPMTLNERVFQTFWRPEVLMILMLIAVYGVIAEVSNPGAIFPGVLGAVALILALYMSSAIPVNAAGLALLGIGIALFIAEAFTPTFGVFLGGGALSFFFGLFLLFDRADPLFHLSLVSIIPATLVTAAFFIFVVHAGLRAQFLHSKTGGEALLGLRVLANTAINAESGKVFLEGSYWNAVSAEPIGAGGTVEVIGSDGLTLKVKAAESTA